MTSQTGAAGAASQREIDPRCAEAQADGVPCAGVEPACEDCERSRQAPSAPGNSEDSGD